MWWTSVTQSVTLLTLKETFHNVKNPPPAPSLYSYMSHNPVYWLISCLSNTVTHALSKRTTLFLETPIFVQGLHSSNYFLSFFFCSFSKSVHLEALKNFKCIVEIDMEEKGACILDNHYFYYKCY